MRYLAALFAASLAVLAGGCATVGDTLQRMPEVTFTSSANPAGYIGCVSPKLLDPWKYSKVIPAGSGSMVIVSNSPFGTPVAVIEAQPLNTGATITVRRGQAIDRVFDPIVGTAKSCS